MYYKIYLDRDDLLVVVCIDYNEYEYEQSRFLTNEDDNQYTFNTEYEGQKFLNKIAKPEFIHKLDILPDNEHMFKISKDKWSELLW